MRPGFFEASPATHSLPGKGNSRAVKTGMCSSLSVRIRNTLPGPPSRKVSFQIASSHRPRIWAQPQNEEL